MVLGSDVLRAALYVLHKRSLPDSTVKPIKTLSIMGLTEEYMKLPRQVLLDAINAMVLMEEVTLSLDVKPIDRRGPMPLPNRMDWVKLVGYLLRAATKLESVSIHHEMIERGKSIPLDLLMGPNWSSSQKLHHWPCLKSLRLSDFDAVPELLRDLLREHSETLVDVKLENAFLLSPIEGRGPWPPVFEVLKSCGSLRSLDLKQLGSGKESFHFHLTRQEVRAWTVWIMNGIHDDIKDRLKKIGRKQKRLTRCVPCPCDRLEEFFSDDDGGEWE
ncbi:MAG: hypothetical protein M1825_001928 [Sarcosagium campestre]|nr:MAG: hypothetical protein M1825_001928 [Sarcosagium campestre]